MLRLPLMMEAPAALLAPKRYVFCLYSVFKLTLTGIETVPCDPIEADLTEELPIREVPGKKS